MRVADLVDHLLRRTRAQRWAPGLSITYTGDGIRGVDDGDQQDVVLALLASDVSQVSPEESGQ